MIRQLLLASVIALGSTCTLINAASTQTSDSYTNQLLRQAQGVAADAQRDIQRYKPQADAYQAYLQRLYSACVNYGNRAACNEYQVRIRRQTQHQQNLQRQYDSYYNRRWVDSFGGR